MFAAAYKHGIPVEHLRSIAKQENHPVTEDKSVYISYNTSNSYRGKKSNCNAIIILLFEYELWISF